MSLCGCEQ